MDKTLAEIYGTNTPDEAEVEKLAAAELAEQLSQEDGIDLDNLDEEQLEALAEEVLNADAGDEGAEQEGEQADLDEGQMKVAEADYLGRVMAHAYVQEIRGIQKEAGKVTDAVKGFAGAAKRGFGRLKNPMKEHRKGRVLKAVAKDTPHGGKNSKAMMDRAAKGKGDKASALHAQYGRSHRAQTAMSRRRKELGAAGATVAGGAALAGGAGLAAHKAMSKQSSAIDTLAEQRALEILAANGVDFEATKEAAGTDAYDVLADVVEQRAVELLEANGYEFEQE